MQKTEKMHTSASQNRKTQKSQHGLGFQNDNIFDKRFSHPQPIPTNLKNCIQEGGFGVGEIIPGVLFGSKNIVLGSSRGGEEIKPGTLHGGEEIKPGTLHGGEEIKPGTLHTIEYSPATYRTKDGIAQYKFRYVNIGGKFEIDIIFQPSYEGKNESSSIAHRLSSARGGKKICLSVGKEPTDIETAKKICMEWAELTHSYIKTGKSIDKQVKEKSNPISKLWNNLVN